MKSSETSPPSSFRLRTTFMLWHLCWKCASSMLRLSNERLSDQMILSCIYVNSQNLCSSFLYKTVFNTPKTEVKPIQYSLWQVHWPELQRSICQIILCFCARKCGGCLLCTKQLWKRLSNISHVLFQEVTRTRWTQKILQLFLGVLSSGKTKCPKAVIFWVYKP